MLLAVCPNPDALATITANLRSRTRKDVVAFDNGAMARRIAELNPVEAVVIDLRNSSKPWLKRFCRDFSDTPCIALGLDAVDPHELLSVIPPTAKTLSSPTDWDRVASAVAQACCEDPASPPEMVAVGLEEVLPLLAMSNSSVELDVQSGRHRGQLYLRDGQVFHAQRLNRFGPHVAYEILDWHAPRVTSKPLPTSTPIPATMHLSASTLLYEAARRRDELARLPSLHETQMVLERLAYTAGFVGSALVHIDNERILTTRGNHDEAIYSNLNAAAQSAATQWASCATECDLVGCGSVLFSHDYATVVVPLSWQLALAVMFNGFGELGQIREAVRGAASYLTTITTRVAQPVEVANALPW